MFNKMFLFVVGIVIGIYLDQTYKIKRIKDICRKEDEDKNN
jgi:hypothetical protein